MFPSHILTCGFLSSLEPNALIGSLIEPLMGPHPSTIVLRSDGFNDKYNWSKYLLDKTGRGKLRQGGIRVLVVWVCACVCVCVWGGGENDLVNPLSNVIITTVDCCIIPWHFECTIIICDWSLKNKFFCRVSPISTTLFCYITCILKRPSLRDLKFHNLSPFAWKHLKVRQKGMSYSLYGSGRPPSR